MGPQTLVFRADASLAIGTGHVMRCLALAQAWQDQGGQCLFALAQATPSIEERLRAEGMEVARFSSVPASVDDAAELIDLAQANGVSWAVVDGYDFGIEYQRILKSAGLKQLFVDDSGHAGEYCADLVLDANAHASESFYARREASTRLLLGTRYALLRREFSRWQEWKREIAPGGRKVLVTMGGSDPENVSAVVVEGLRLLGPSGPEVVLVVGGSNPNLSSLRHAILNSTAKIELKTDVTDMGELMAWADVAVSGAGTTCWELCLVGLPSILIDLAPNQRPLVQELDRTGAAIHLGSAREISARAIANKLEWLLTSQECRNSMSRVERSLVDGRGAPRVVSAIQGNNLRLRPVEQEDCRLLWEWANDPEVRAASFEAAPIPFHEHMDWFTRQLSAPGCVMLIATDEDGPLGQIRLTETRRDEAEIHISIARERRGKGHAGSLIDLAAQSQFAKGRLERLHAWVKLDNPASAKAFEAAEFVRAETGKVKGCPAVHYIRDRRDSGVR